jgi:hypothetical protein
MSYLANTMALGISDGIEVSALEGESIQNGRYIEISLNEEDLYKTIVDTYYQKVDK